MAMINSKPEEPDRRVTKTTKINRPKTQNQNKEDSKNTLKEREQQKPQKKEDRAKWEKESKKKTKNLYLNKYIYWDSSYLKLNNECFIYIFYGPLA